jgi:hypothetical protein
VHRDLDSAGVDPQQHRDHDLGRSRETAMNTPAMADLFVTCLAMSLLGIAGVCLVLSLTPLVDEAPPDAQQPGCWCERMDLETGDTLTLPDPHCPVHELEMLAATLRDHAPGCRCGCGGAW